MVRKKKPNAIKPILNDLMSISQTLYDHKNSSILTSESTEDLLKKLKNYLKILGKQGNTELIESCKHLVSETQNIFEGFQAQSRQTEDLFASNEAQAHRPEVEVKSSAEAQDLIVAQKQATKGVTDQIQAETEGPNLDVIFLEDSMEIENFDSDTHFLEEYLPDSQQTYFEACDPTKRSKLDPSVDPQLKFDYESFHLGNDLLNLDLFFQENSDEKSQIINENTKKRGGLIENFSSTNENFGYKEIPRHSCKKFLSHSNNREFETQNNPETNEEIFSKTNENVENLGKFSKDEKPNEFNREIVTSEKPEFLGFSEKIWNENPKNPGVLIENLPPTNEKPRYKEIPKHSGKNFLSQLNKRQFEKQNDPETIEGISLKKARKTENNDPDDNPKIQRRYSQLPLDYFFSKTKENHKNFEKITNEISKNQDGLIENFSSTNKNPGYKGIPKHSCIITQIINRPFKNQKIEENSNNHLTSSDNFCSKTNESVRNLEKIKENLPFKLSSTIENLNDEIGNFFIHLFRQLLVISSLNANEKNQLVTLIKNYGPSENKNQNKSIDQPKKKFKTLFVPEVDISDNQIEENSAPNEKLTNEVSVQTNFEPKIIQNPPTNLNEKIEIISVVSVNSNLIGKPENPENLEKLDSVDKVDSISVIDNSIDLNKTFFEENVTEKPLAIDLNVSCENLSSQNTNISTIKRPTLPKRPKNQPKLASQSSKNSESGYSTTSRQSQKNSKKSTNSSRRVNNRSQNPSMDILGNSLLEQSLENSARYTLTKSVRDQLSSVNSRWTDTWDCNFFANNELERNINMRKRNVATQPVYPELDVMTNKRSKI